MPWHQSPDGPVNNGAPSGDKNLSPTLVRLVDQQPRAGQDRILPGLDKGGVLSLFYFSADSWLMMDKTGVPLFPSDVWTVDHPVV